MNTMYTPSPVDSEMLDAAASGNLRKLKKIKKKIGNDGEFKKRCDLANDCIGLRVLHYAAEMGLIDMCEFLIEQVKVEIDVKTDRGDTPLLHAVKNGHANTAEYLVNHGAKIAASDSRGLTSLHYAVQRGDKELMQMLLTKGANIEAKSVDGTPLQCAALSGNVKTLKFLLGRGAEPNTVCMLSGSPLICAIKSRSCECMELLLKAGADPNTCLYGLCPLAHAVVEGQTECLKSLLVAGANPDSDHLRPIEHAALEHNDEGVRILLPVSQRIPFYSNWTVDGIMEYFHSDEAKTMRAQRRNDYLDSVKQNGKSAWSRQEYISAVRWYSEAIYLDPRDEKMLSNRSLCWARLGEATFALHDAEKCVRLNPQWHKAHYMEGAAWNLLRNYYMSSTAFKRASMLAPQNAEIIRAFKESMGNFLLDMYTRHPAEAWSLIQLLDKFR